MAWLKRKNVPAYDDEESVDIASPSCTLTDLSPRTDHQQIVRNVVERKRRSVYTNDEGEDFFALENDQHTYTLGNSAFLVVGIVKNRPYIHIKGYRTYVSSPSCEDEGVYFTPHQFIALTENGKMAVRTNNVFQTDHTKVNELRVRMFLPFIRDPSQIMDNFPYADRKFSFKYTNYVYNEQDQNIEDRTTSIILDDAHWRQLFVLRAAVIESAVTFLYADINIEREYQFVSGKESFSSYYAEDIGKKEKDDLQKVFFDVLERKIKDAGFVPAYRDFSCCSYNKIIEFNSCLLKLNFSAMVKEFCEIALNDGVPLDFVYLDAQDIVPKLRYKMCEIDEID